MTETEWLASEDPQAMMTAVTGQNADGLTVPYAGGLLPEGYAPGKAIVSDRKLRLFACACAVTTGQDADNADRVSREYEGNGAAWAFRWAHTVPNTPSALITQAKKADILRDIIGNPFKPAVVLPRDIATVLKVGARNYEQKNVVLADWLTPDVVALAHAAYDERGSKCPIVYCRNGKIRESWGDADSTYSREANCTTCHGTGRINDGTLDPVRLSILADALEEAGCPSWSESPCPRCSLYKDDPCPRCHGRKTVFNVIPYVVNGVACPWCDGAGKSPPGYHPERDPASGRHEGGWTNCKTCNCGGRTECAIGMVRVASPLLAHLRSPGPHYRGCWAVDLVRGVQ